MIGQSIFHLITVIFMAVTGDPDVNPGELLAMLMNAIAMGLAVMLLLARRTTAHPGRNREHIRLQIMPHGSLAYSPT